MSETDDAVMNGMGTNIREGGSSAPTSSCRFRRRPACVAATQSGAADKADDAVTQWIPAAEHMPTEADADKQGCVLAWHEYQGVIVLHIHNMTNFGTFITHWMPTPAPP